MKKVYKKSVRIYVIMLRIERDGLIMDFKDSENNQSVERIEIHGRNL